MNAPLPAPIATVTPENADQVGRRIPLDEIESGLVREFAALWAGKRGTRRFPAREEISPRDMMRFLRHVTLYRVPPDGSDFEYRVMGDAAVQAWGRSFIGCNKDALNRIHAGMGDVIQRICASIARRGEPLVLRGELSKGEFEHIGQECLFLPMGPDDATVDHVLSIAWYTPKPPAAPRIVSPFPR